MTGVAPMPAELRDVRLRLGIKQMALAAEIGVSPQALSSWETGERLPKFENYRRWIGALDRDSARAE